MLLSTCGQLLSDSILFVHDAHWMLDRHDGALLCRDDAATDEPNQQVALSALLQRLWSALLKWSKRSMQERVVRQRVATSVPQLCETWNQSSPSLGSASRCASWNESESIL